jgi:hypothetical protein
MKYQYYSQISDKYGLIILDDRTVLYKDGNLLVQNRRFRGPKQMGKVNQPEPELLPPEAPGNQLPMLKQ